VNSALLEDAENAIKALQGKDLKGRKLKLESAVKKARGRNAAKETENVTEVKEEDVTKVEVVVEEKVEIEREKAGKEKKEKKEKKVANVEVPIVEKKTIADKTKNKKNIIVVDEDVKDTLKDKKAKKVGKIKTFVLLNILLGRDDSIL
jgi:RNA recognition motif-containing protein